MVPNGSPELLDTEVHVFFSIPLRKSWFMCLFCDKMPIFLFFWAIEQPCFAYNWWTNGATGLRLVPNESPGFVVYGADQFVSILIRFKWDGGVFYHLVIREANLVKNLVIDSSCSAYNSRTKRATEMGLVPNESPRFVVFESHIIF